MLPMFIIIVPRICIGWNRIQIPTPNKSAINAAQGLNARRAAAPRGRPSWAMRYAV